MKYLHVLDTVYIFLCNFRLKMEPKDGAQLMKPFKRGSVILLKVRARASTEEFC